VDFLKELNQYTGTLLAACAVLLFGCIYSLNSIWKVIVAFREDYRKVNCFAEREEAERLSNARYP
jgi:hypothetical protein